ncbi:hypothetical protein GCM10027578_29220 [Spirosoma luteolum]
MARLPAGIDAWRKPFVLAKTSTRFNETGAVALTVLLGAAGFLADCARAVEPTTDADRKPATSIMREGSRRFFIKNAD